MDPAVRDRVPDLDGRRQTADGRRQTAASLEITDLPAVNATLNGTSAVLLVLAYRAIRARAVERHRRLMLAAAAVSTVFLGCYLWYHAHVGSVRFTGQGPVRALYFTILGTHTLLAIVIVPLVLRTLFLGLKRRDPQHRRIARWTFPLWLYVSVTGVVIYVMLYQLYPPGPIRVR